MPYYPINFTEAQVVANMNTRMAKTFILNLFQSSCKLITSLLQE